jgi:hypothetical protein
MPKKEFNARIQWERDVRSAEKKRIAFDKAQERKRQKFIKKLFKNK